MDPLCPGVLIWRALLSLLMSLSTGVGRSPCDDHLPVLSALRWSSPHRCQRSHLPLKADHAEGDLSRLPVSSQLRPVPWGSSRYSWGHPPLLSWPLELSQLPSPLGTHPRDVQRAGNHAKLCRLISGSDPSLSPSCTIWWATAPHEDLQRVSGTLVQTRAVQ